MWLLVLSYIGGVLTILSPCILPVIPFVFAKADQPFRKSGLPLLLGMALTFAVFSSLAVIGGAWVVQANTWGRGIAMVLLAIFGVSLIFPSFFEKFFEPFTRWGSKLSSGSSSQQASFLNSLLLGVATGLLWAPCAGPILGLILTGAATQGTPEKALVFLVAYALGAATSLMLALMAGGKFLGTLKKSLKAERAIKACLGVAVLLGVLVIGFNLDRTVLTQLSKVQTEEFENKLIDTFHPSLAKKNASSTDMEEDPLRALPISLDGATKWLNSPPLSFESLKGKVVLVDFWTYSCINCLRTLPYVKSWAAKYKNQGLVVIGVHTPEFAFEKDPSNVMKALRDLEITYPIAMDNDYVIWNSFENRYWPAHYFIDRTGKIRHHHFGEGGYEESEKVIQELLQEGSTETTKVAAKNSTSPSSALSSTESAPARGVQMPAQMADVKSPETYVGYSRAQNLRVQPELEEDEAQKYQAVKNLQLNEWSLSGTWLVNEESATLLKAGGQVIYRFHARDLHLVLGPQKEGSKIKFRVTLDGQAPGKNHGVDTDEKGYGVIDEHRLYQLIRQQDQDIRDRTFEIEFLDSGVAVFAFTFG